ncbi:unnamed protein product [Clavelina lepadiformis]|uniref:Protein quiver n=1 Tax=Clavelina lepadiformis TaxID=159417 RepID=A0ABP0FKG4_CLALP
MEVIWIAIAVSLLAANSEAINCYQCTYTSVAAENDCLGPKPAAKNLLRCPAGYDHCSTTTSKMNIFGTETESIVRNCSEIYISRQCISVEGVKGCTSFCSSDGCNSGNGSSVMRATILTFAVAFFAALLVSKW